MPQGGCSPQCPSGLILAGLALGCRHRIGRILPLVGPSLAERLFGSQMIPLPVTPPLLLFGGASGQ